MEFELPDFLLECDVETIHSRMMERLPTGIDSTEGGFPWDFTRPTALIASELLEFYAPNILQLMFPQWSTGSFLDLHASMAQVSRRAATYATTNLKITGTPGTVIQTGSIFSTASVDDEAEAIEFTTDDPASIGEDGTVMIVATATAPGKASNVPEHTITMMADPIEGVTAVTNPEKATGGTDEEDDDTLRVRVLAAFSASNESFTGNDADYKRWAEEVSGMGTAIVISEWDGPETVKIVCIDANGDAASSKILDDIYKKIMSPDVPLDRLAPPNTILTVSAPEMVNISYSVVIELDPDFDLEGVKETFKQNLEEYYKKVSKDGEVKYTRVCSILSNTTGVSDYTDLLMNGSQKNIPITQEQFPFTYEIEAETASGVNDR